MPNPTSTFEVIRRPVSRLQKFQREYTPEEDKQILAWRKTKQVNEIAKLLNRSPASVSNRIARIIGKTERQKLERARQLKDEQKRYQIANSLKSSDTCPIKRAMTALDGRAEKRTIRHQQVYYLDGKPALLHNLFDAANEIIRKQGGKVIGR